MCLHIQKMFVHALLCGCDGLCLTLYKERNVEWIVPEANLLAILWEKMCLVQKIQFPFFSPQHKIT